MGRGHLPRARTRGAPGGPTDRPPVIRGPRRRRPSSVMPGRPPRRHLSPVRPVAFGHRRPPDPELVAARRRGIAPPSAPVCDESAGAADARTEGNDRCGRGEGSGRRSGRPGKTNAAGRRSSETPVDGGWTAECEGRRSGSAGRRSGSADPGGVDRRNCTACADGWMNLELELGEALSRHFSCPSPVIMLRHNDARPDRPSEHASQRKLGHVLVKTTSRG